jgi:hypothetical protein
MVQIFEEVSYCYRCHWPYIIYIKAGPKEWGIMSKGLGAYAHVLCRVRELESQAIPSMMRKQVIEMSKGQPLIRCLRQTS